MTNQASEGGLQEQLADKLERYSRYRERGQDDDMDRAFDGILALIRTEKLKLLAEVRERVQVNQKGQFEEDGTGSVCWYLDDLVEALKELEAEL